MVRAPNTTLETNADFASLRRHGSALRSAAMRAVLLLLLLFLCGCDFWQPANPSSREVTDKGGTNRLSLIYVPAGPGPVANSQSFAFHSLVWRTKAGTNWSDRVVITKTDFQAGTPGRRTVHDIFSFDPTTGNAVIKVSEDALPQTNGTTVSTPHVYSWREWNIATNAEVRVLRVCKDPFEPYTRSRIKLFK